MAVYTSQEWLKKCNQNELDALENSMLMNARTEADRLLRNNSVKNVQYFMHNKLFIEGIYEEVSVDRETIYKNR